MTKLFVTWVSFQLLFVSHTLVAQTDVVSLSTTQSPTKATDQPTTVSSTSKVPEPVPESTTKTPNPDNVTDSLLSNNTTSSITTESTTTEVNPTTQIPPTEPHHAHLNYDLFCTCDLLAGRCDINCCCDPDCSTEDHRLFDRCWTPPSSYFDLNYCSADPNRYGVVWNNTPEYWTEWNPHSGLFCIVTDNVPKKRMFEEKPPTTEDEMFQHILPKLSSRWNDRQVPISGLENWVYQPFYKEGSPLFILHRNGTIDTLSNKILKEIKLIHIENIYEFRITEVTK